MWRAQITERGKGGIQHHCGDFAIEADAARAADDAARKYHGNSAKPNFPAEGEQGIPPKSLHVAACREAACGYNMFCTAVKKEQVARKKSP
jgi:hypothetical protein